MQKDLRIGAGKPYPPGVSRDESGINVSMIITSDRECGMILYDDKKKKIGSIPFSGGPQAAGISKMGDLHFTKIFWEGKETLLYQFYEDEKIIYDPHMKACRGHERFGVEVGPEDLFGELSLAEFDWEEDRCPGLLYEDSVMYCMHVRGFTRHPSSGVAGRGTFSGIEEKLPYLQELGITTLELLPVYEWEEKRRDTKAEAVHGTGRDTVNYWGYAQGLYYMPRNAYAMSGRGDREFKKLVKALHKRNMEVILQFYFPGNVKQSEIFDILRYWKIEYHVDGFHLKGDHLPLFLLAQEPGFADTKLFYYDFPVDQLYPGDQLPGVRNLASYRDDYRYEMRRFLKGDEDMLYAVTKHMRRQPAKEGQINYFTNYDGFTLEDMVSYERKHNEDNGEDNRDGNIYNYTWNCGVEGKSRKKSIQSLRRKQVRNALCMLFFSQGTPLLFMGDEFGNSQKGNNNPYCQDNEVSWLNWKNLDTNRDLVQYVQSLIAVRKAHPILHKGTELRLMDYISCGYPDLSYHATRAWQPDMANYSRHIGIMYCGKYAKRHRDAEDDFFYIAMNMHWEEHEFALPKLPKGRNWYLLTDTCEWDIFEENGRLLENQQTAAVGPRSIQVYIGKKEW